MLAVRVNIEHLERLLIHKALLHDLLLLLFHLFNFPAFLVVNLFG